MCAICELKIAFSVDHPMTLPIAVATRQAIDAGGLAAAADDDPLGGMKLRVAAIDALQTLQRRVEAALSREELLALPDFFALLIESRTWGFFHPTESGFDPDCRPEPPRMAATDPVDRDAVIITSETALGALLDGRIPLAQAFADDLIVVDADPARAGMLQTALAAAFPAAGFSRFVCN